MKLRSIASALIWATNPATTDLCRDQNVFETSLACCVNDTFKYTAVPMYWMDELSWSQS